MKNLLFKSLLMTIFTGMTIVLTPKTSIAQVNMSLLTEVVGSCQEDVFSSEYYNEKLGFNFSEVELSDENADKFVKHCIRSRYFYSLVLSKLPWLASTEEMLPGYPGSVAVSLITYIMYPVGTDLVSSWILEPNQFLNCLITQDSYSKECSNPSSFGQSLYRGDIDNSVKITNLNSIGFDSWDSFASWMCPSCYVAYNNYPSGRKMVGSFIEWFMKLEPSRRKELMSILGGEETPRNNRFNMRSEAVQAVEEYTAIRQKIAAEAKERQRRELFGE